jgi:RNA polymerase sigma factor (sigma-70 family)
MSGSFEPPALPAAWVAGVLERFEAPLLAYARRLVGDEHGARDVVQDVFLRLCGQPRAAVEPVLAPWLYRVCRNRAIDVRRKGRPMTPVDSATLDATTAPTPPGSLERLDDVARALAEVATLPAPVQEVLRLKFAHGLSYKEIAEVTGLSVSHVGVRIHEGMTVLRRRLAREPRPATTDGGVR